MSLTTHRRSDLTKYNPVTGVKTIVGFEAAEKHFAKAKDVAQLLKAIRAKLDAQAEFVLWWKTQGPGTNKGGAGRGQGRKGHGSAKSK